MKEPLSPGARRVVLYSLLVQVLALLFNVWYFNHHTMPTATLTEEFVKLSESLAANE